MRRELIHRLIDELFDLRSGVAMKVPDEAWHHFQSAKREALLGLRSVIDHALERNDMEEDGGQKESKHIPLDL